MLRTTNPQHSLWEAIVPTRPWDLSAELARVDTMLDDPRFLAPLASHFNLRIGRSSVPLDTYLRIMFLKFRYRLGYELLCREVTDSIFWQRFCRIPLGGQVSHPTTLVKLTRRLGEQTVTALNEALLAQAVGRKVLRTHKVRADTTVVAANVAYPIALDELLPAAWHRSDRYANITSRPTTAVSSRGCVRCAGAGRIAAPRSCSPGMPSPRTCGVATTSWPSRSR